MSRPLEILFPPNLNTPPNWLRIFPTPFLYHTRQGTDIIGACWIKSSAFFACFQAVALAVLYLIEKERLSLKAGTGLESSKCAISWQFCWLGASANVFIR